MYIQCGPRKRFGSADCVQRDRYVMYIESNQTIRTFSIDGRYNIYYDNKNNCKSVFVNCKLIIIYLLQINALTNL